MKGRGAIRKLVGAELVEYELSRRRRGGRRGLSGVHGTGMSVRWFDGDHLCRASRRRTPPAPLRSRGRSRSTAAKWVPLEPRRYKGIGKDHLDGSGLLVPVGARVARTAAVMRDQSSAVAWRRSRAWCQHLVPDPAGPRTPRAGRCPRSPAPTTGVRASGAHSTEPHRPLCPCRGPRLINVSRRVRLADSTLTCGLDHRR